MGVPSWRGFEVLAGTLALLEEREASVESKAEGSSPFLVTELKSEQTAGTRTSTDGHE